MVMPVTPRLVSASRTGSRRWVLMMAVTRCTSALRSCGHLGAGRRAGLDRIRLVVVDDRAGPGLGGEHEVRVADLSELASVETFDLDLGRDPDLDELPDDQEQGV